MDWKKKPASYEASLGILLMFLCFRVWFVSISELDLLTAF